MPKLDTISGIDPPSRELLEVAGWTDAKDLAAADPAVLHADLVRANGIFSLSGEVPAVDVIGEWVAQARGLTGIAPPTPAVDEPGDADVEAGADEIQAIEVDYESDSDVQDMIVRAPLAVPISNRQLAAQGILPSEIAIAPVLNRATSDLEVRVTSRPRKKITPKAAAQGAMRQLAGVTPVADFTPAEGRKLDSSRVRSIDDARSGLSPVTALPKRVTESERLNLLKSPREATNRGKDPNSRRYIRGVLHDRPYLVWFGCLIALLFQLMVPLAIAAAPLLFLSESNPDSFGWVPEWVLAFPMSLPVLGLLYFMISTSVKCRVCGQKLMVPRHCRKNNKAHHVPGLGYVMPLAFHTLVFRWFRCSFCGTSVRIKE